MSQPRRSPAPLELWGGPECTVARIADAYVDQFELTGHDRRIDDLDLFASLGITALRYPVHWEARRDRMWTDRRLARIRTLGLRPIVGLVHHGSGPPRTSLLDPAFPAGLAEHARRVAERYPWVEDWTPVNEPLTTARFSALYGLWYPHARDDRSFARALLIQCRAVVESMRAIREVIPHARLVQTDDLGKTHSTPPLRYQAEFENERRWLTFDLLCGRIDDAHPLWEWLDAPRELEWFLDHPCPPDLIGVNHYLSSERFLDDDVERHPGEPVGGNGTDRYVDVLAVREGRAIGPAGLLLEAWHRFGIPLAVTEAHNGCTREEQLRWIDDIWDAAQRARDAGADVRAVTLWSLLGAVGWDRMLTASPGRYESGVFDVSSGTPRATALVAMARALARGEPFDHPVLESSGWWHGHEGRAAATPLLVAATGAPADVVERACVARGLAYVLGGENELRRVWGVVDLSGTLAGPCARHGLPHVRIDRPEDIDRVLDELVDAAATPPARSSRPRPRRRRAAVPAALRAR
jgi:dTDP-4-dehydrorhamnose reductase